MSRDGERERIRKKLFACISTPHFTSMSWLICWMPAAVSAAVMLKVKPGGMISADVELDIANVSIAWSIVASFDRAICVEGQDFRACLQSVLYSGSIRGRHTRIITRTS